MIPTLIGITVLSFIFMKVAPGEPSGLSGNMGEAGGGIDPAQFAIEVRKSKRELLGLAATYEYKFVTTDTDGDKIKYVIDWGDSSPQATSYFVQSGQTVIYSHSWEPAGTYAIRVKAIDEKGANSAWSEPLLVTITGGRPGTPTYSKIAEEKQTPATRENKPPNKPVPPEGPTVGVVDTPIFTQYFTWLSNIAHLSFGNSSYHHRPVTDLLAERVPVTLLLSVISMFLSYLIAVPLGVFSSTGHMPFLDRSLTLVLFILYSLPSFWVATMMLFLVSQNLVINPMVAGIIAVLALLLLFLILKVFSKPLLALTVAFTLSVGLFFLMEGWRVKLPISHLHDDPIRYEKKTAERKWEIEKIVPWEKASPWEKVKSYALHLILPILCSTYGSLAALSRYARSGMLEVVRQDFIRTARAKGLSERTVILKHALRNGLIPIITLMANILPGLIGGLIIIEQIFSIEGMGKLLFEAVMQRDYNVIMAETVLVGILTLLGILLSDILYVMVDPRISFEKIKA